MLSAPPVISAIEAQCPGRLAAVDVRDVAGGLDIHADSSGGVLDGQLAGDQSPLGSVVCPTSIR